MPLARGLALDYMASAEQVMKGMLQWLYHLLSASPHKKEGIAMSYQPGQPVPPAPPYAPAQAPAPGEFSQYSPQPIVLTRRGFDAGKLWKSLGWPGQVCLVGGLLLFCSFFFAWFNARLVCMGAGCDNPTASRFISQGFTGDSSFSGFTITASTITFRSTNDFRSLSTAGNFIEIYNFPLLWIVLLGSAALILLPVAVAQGKLAARRGQILILLAAGAALFVEILYAFSAVSALPQSKASASALSAFLTLGIGQGTAYLATGVEIGFWLGLLATLAVGSTSLLVRLFADRAAHQTAAASHQPPVGNVVAQPVLRRRPEQ